MKYITKREYESKLQKIQRQNESKERKKLLKEERKKSKPIKQKHTTTKLLMAFIFINCSIIEIYSMIAMWFMRDLSPLYALITSVVTESISFAVYAAKSYNETKQEEKIKLEREELELEYGIEPDTNSDGAAG